MTTGRQVKRLFDLEIDEVSLVDRPANQFGKVAFSKRAEDDMPILFDLDGNEVTEDELEHGETVSDENGNEFVFLQEGTPEFDELVADVDDSYDDDEDYDDEDAYDDDLVGVGKAMKFTGVGRMRDAELKYTRASRGGARVGGAVGTAAGTAYRRSGARAARGAAQRGVDRAGGAYRGSRVGRAHLAASERAFQASTRGGKAKNSFGRRVLAGSVQKPLANVGYRSYTNPGRYAAGAGAVAGAGAYGANRRRKGVRKSFGGEIYEELAKALTQTDRDEAIAKALDVVDDLAEQNAELYDIVGKMADDAALEDFSKLAEEYGPLPVHPARLGAIMKRASDTLPEEDVAILDRLFSSVGDQLYTEVGKAGTGASVDVWDQVQALANDVVAKSDMTPEQAVTAIFAENPDAYDEYVAEHEFAIRGR